LTADLKVFDHSNMNRDITITARWDGEAHVWLATSEQVPGLVVEAETWPMMIEEVSLVVPDLLVLSGMSKETLSLTFKAEEHLTLAGA
jgi:3-deoxy-D-manno-octulosonic-acid transferase